MRNTTIVVLSLLSVFYFLIGIFTDIVYFYMLKVMGAFGIFQLLLSVYSYVKCKQPLISPYFVFIGCMYIFSFGQSLMYPFDLIGKLDLNGFRGITIEEIFNGQIITLIYLAFFHIGALLKGNTKKMSVLNQRRALNQNRRLKQIAWFVIVISIYPYYQEIITNAILSLTYGYGAIYRQKTHIGLNNAFGILSDFFIPGLIALYISYRHNTKWRIGIVCVLLFNVLVLLATGGRSEAVIMLVMILILHNYLVKPFTKKMIMIIGALAFGLLIVLPVVGKMRGIEDRSIEQMVNADTGDNPAVESISEMGWSMFNLIKTENIVPEEEDFRYGTSYLMSFTSIIPNLGFWDIHPAKKYANMSDWMTDKLNMGYGTGYSMCAEAYANFGYFGAFMMMLLGYVFNSFFGNLKNAISANCIAFVVLSLIIFWFSLKMPRNSFIGIVRAFFYYSLPIYWYVRGYIFKINR